MEEHGILKIYLAVVVNREDRNGVESFWSRTVTIRTIRCRRSQAKETFGKFIADNGWAKTAEVRAQFTVDPECFTTYDL